MPGTRRFFVRVHEDGGTPTVDVMHWGRPINDTGSAAFPAGRDRQWDQDLYFMLLMNLSGKPGEAPGQASLSSTTGRFGLGFKSVHLLSSSPSVVSGFIAFSIAGGFAPPWSKLSQKMPTHGRLKAVGQPEFGCRCGADVDANELIRSLFRRFSYARALLPAFARQVREVVVVGGPYPGTHVFDGHTDRRCAWVVDRRRNGATQPRRSLANCALPTRGCWTKGAWGPQRWPSVFEMAYRPPSSQICRFSGTSRRRARNGPAATLSTDPSNLTRAEPMCRSTKTRRSKPSVALATNSGKALSSCTMS